MSFQELKVMIGVLDSGMWHSGFGQSLRNLEFAFRNYSVKGWPKQHLRTMITTGSVLSKSRWQTVLAAREMIADYLLFIDSDQTFPKTTLHTLIGHRVDVVGANIAVKRIPSQPTARNKPDSGSFVPKPVYTDEESTGLEEVWRLGTGLIMLNKRVIQALPDDCFEVRYNWDIKDYQGEDWTMCQAIEKLGFKIFVDHDLSKAVGHLGLFEYTHDVVGEVIRPDHNSSPGSIKTPLSVITGGIFK